MMLLDFTGQLERRRDGCSQHRRVQGVANAACIEAAASSLSMGRHEGRATSVACCWVSFKPCTHYQQSWIQHGRLCWKSTVQQIGNKVDCCRIRSTVLQVSATNRKQREFDILSRSTLLPIRSTLLPVCTGPNDMVDFVDFQQSRSCWIQLCRQCVPGLILAAIACGYETETCIQCVPKNETGVILNILYSCKSVAMKFSMHDILI